MGVGGGGGTGFLPSEAVGLSRARMVLYAESPSSHSFVSPMVFLWFSSSIFASLALALSTVITELFFWHAKNGEKRKTSEEIVSKSY